MKPISTLIRKLVVTSVGLASTAGLLVGAMPATGAHAVGIPKGQGYGWLTRDHWGGVTSSSSSGQPASLFHVATGRWRATFPGLPANTAGVAEVSPGTAAIGATCALEQWYGQSAVTRAGTKTAIVVEFHCADRFGNLLDNDFTASFTSVAGINEGWAVSGGPALQNPAQTYNWMGGPVALTKIGTPGNYRVGYHGIVAGNGVALTSALDPASYDRHCTTLPLTAKAIPAVTTMDVACHHADGTSAATSFANHLFSGRGQFADPSLVQSYAVVDGPQTQTHWSSAGVVSSYRTAAGTAEVKKLFNGLYQVKFDGLAGTTRMVHVDANAPANADVRCEADTTFTAGADAIVTVFCTHADTTVADTRFTVAYSATP